jgi:hypothetical protein
VKAKAEERSVVGYIRTCMLSRVLPLVGEDRSTRIVARRSKCPRESNLRAPWLRHTIQTQDEWDLNWRREMGPLPVDEMWRQLLSSDITDLIVNELDWVSGPYLLKMKSKSGPEVKGLRYVSELNERFWHEIGYPVGVLDVVDVRRAVRGFPRVDEFDAGQLHAVLRTLRSDDWPKADRTVRTDGVQVVAKPAAIRFYSESANKELVLVGEEDA